MEPETKSEALCEGNSLEQFVRNFVSQDRNRAYRYTEVIKTLTLCISNLEMERNTLMQKVITLTRENQKLRDEACNALTLQPVPLIENPGQGSCV